MYITEKRLLQRSVTLLFFLLSNISFSQLNSSGEINFNGLFGTEENLPFWMYSNQRGRISEKTEFSGWITGKAIYEFSHFHLSAGGGVLFQDAQNKLLLDELYIGFHNTWLNAVIGRKQKLELYNGLSSSNGNILWSINARPLPGVEFSTARPILIFPWAGLGFEASLEEYLLDDKRHVNNARIHHKSLHLVFQPFSRFQLKAGLQHFVQWAGTSSTFGKQPNDFDAYIRIFTGQSGGENALHTDQLNALGNNIGSYEIYLKYQIKNYNFTIFYNHLFEDGSGRRLGNTPDGRYGLFIEKTHTLQLVHSLMYEFYYTKHQSHTTTGIHKFDNYFNNGVYRSGWTYENRTIGSPFFMSDPEGTGIINNTMIVHHVGLGGFVFKTFPYKLIGSYRKNKGVHKLGLYPTRNIYSSLLEIKFLNSYLDLNLQIGSDISDDSKPNFGFGLNLNKKI